MCWFVSSPCCIFGMFGQNTNDSSGPAWETEQKWPSSKTMLWTQVLLRKLLNCSHLQIYLNGLFVRHASHFHELCLVSNWKKLCNKCKHFGSLFCNLVPFLPHMHLVHIVQKKSWYIYRGTFSIAPRSSSTVYVPNVGALANGQSSVWKVQVATNAAEISACINMGQLKGYTSQTRQKYVDLQKSDMN